MPIKRKHFEQLITPQSCNSPVSVIAHIDLDAFYAQCLGVYHNIDPTEPLGCRQWNALIAINYPARKYGLKRGVSVDEARKLCPGIYLPHVASFKKGDSHWDFHENPDPNGYKVSLDHFRRESRKIFSVFKEHFHKVEKAGIDEGFVDIGAEVHREVLKRHKDIIEKSEITGELELTHDNLLDIGAELVNEVRLSIYERMKYTCSAGIASNKQLAKLGSGYNKPFNQTVVHISEINQFLANFKVTDAWGWGGKVGKEVIDTLKIDDSIQDQCKYIRDNFSLIDLQHELKGNVKLARSLFDMVRGQYSTEVNPRTMLKSMVAVKDFRRLKHLMTMNDIESWLRVFSADLSGRLLDLQDELGCSIVPKTITVRQHTDGLQSKQQPFNPIGTSIAQLKEQLFQQSLAIAKSFVQIPCKYLVVEISHLQELPKERLVFPSSNATVKTRNDDSNDEADKKRIYNDAKGKTLVNEENNESEPDEALFVENDFNEQCPRCGKTVSPDLLQEHQDWHYAKELQLQDKMTSGTGRTSQSPEKKRSVTPKHQSSNGPQKKKNKKSNQSQKSILEFFNK